MSVLSAVPAGGRATRPRSRKEARMATMTDTRGDVVVGVDTHEQEHVAALLDERGRLLASGAFPAHERGFKQLLAWARSYGQVREAGV